MNGPQILLTQQDAAASFDSTATWDQAPATWAASATETFASTATYVQAAATWAAVAGEAFSATGSFSQAAAAWDAIVAETFAASGAWTQAAAAWDASADLPASPDFSATWEQVPASWAAVTSGGDEALPNLPSALGRTTVPETAIRASFSQPAARWAATANVKDDELTILLAA